VNRVNAHTGLFVLSAPYERRNQLTMAVDHEAREAHRRICARATAVKKLKVNLAERAVSLIDDPLQLAAVAAVDKRVAVNNAVKQHPLWSRVPHERLCSTCEKAAGNDQYAQMTSAEEFLATVDADGVRCPVLLVRTLDNMEREQAHIAWRRLRTMLSGSSAMLVSMAAGRGTYAESDSLARWGSDRDLVRLLWAEPLVTAELLTIAVTQRTGLPSHWKPTTEHWLGMLERYARALLRSDYGPGTRFFLEHWESVPQNERALVLLTCRSAEEVRAVLARLEDEPLNYESGNADICMDVLSQYHELDSTDRVALMLRGGRSMVVDCLIGARGVRSNPEETQLLMTAIDKLDPQYVTLRSVARVLSRSTEKIVNREQKTVIDAVLQRLPVTSVFENDGVVARAAHRLLWTELDGGKHAETIAGLLPDWDGTVRELLEAASAV